MAYPSIWLQNTLSGTKDLFLPIDPQNVTLYSCGPTVYDFAHIGNFRSFLVSDLLVRVLKHAGYEVEKVQNITDVGHLVSDADEGEDKIMKKARLEKKDPYAIAQFFTDAFLEDEAILRILPVPKSHRPKATEYIAEQIKITQQLIDAGYGYEVNGSVYFRTRKFEKYGQLSKNNLEDLIAGHRVETHSDKEHSLDFALWKSASENHLMQWDSPWGRGFPGWHVECSAMSQAILGTHFDIHTGGEDNIFPHHECEIAQNECSNHGKKSVNYWLHAKHLMVDGKKMSKSLGNFYTIRDLQEKGWQGNEIRLTLMKAHYRTSLNFSLESLEESKKSIARVNEVLRICKKVSEKNTAPDAFADEAKHSFATSLFDDLNAAGALGVTFEFLNLAMRHHAEDTLTATNAAAVIDFVENHFEPIFDCLPIETAIDEGEHARITQLVKERNAARAEKNWAQADAIRDQLLAQNIEILDEADGTVWRLIGSGV
jgi:cysteinyl-tRNA synthetase